MAETDFSKPLFSTMVEMLEERFKSNFDKIAYIYLADGESKEIKLPYRELEKKTKALAAKMQAMGMKGERALLLYPQGLDFIVAFLSCQLAGVIAVPAYPPDPKRLNRTLPRIEAILKSCDAKLVLSTQMICMGAGAFLPKESPIMALEWLANDTVDLGLYYEWQDPGIVPEDIAFLQYTSGSTGVPKGVEVSHANLLENERMNDSVTDLSPYEIIFSWLPFYHDFGLIAGILYAIYKGCTSVLMSPVDFLKKPSRWLLGITKYSASLTFAPNFAFDLCVNKIDEEDKKKIDLSSVRMLPIGAEPVFHNTLRRFVIEFAPCGLNEEALSPGYGLAEAVLTVTGRKDDIYKTVKIKASGLAQNEAIISDEVGDLLRVVSCGKPLGGEVLVVSPESFEVLEERRVGEVWVSGKHVTSGYFRRPDANEKSFRGFTSDGRGPYLRTGDMAFFHEEELYITGRIKDLIIIRGQNHYPNDIEHTVSCLEWQHSSVRPGSCAAFSVNKDGQEELIIFQEIEPRRQFTNNSSDYKGPERRKKRFRYKTKTGGKKVKQRPFDPNELIQDIRNAVAVKHGVKAFGVYLLWPGSISKTSSGKIQRSECKRAYESKFMEGNIEFLFAWNDSKQKQKQLKTDAKQEAEQKEASDPNLFRSWLVTKLSESLSIDPSRVDIRKPFANLGLDSRDAITITGDLEQLTGSVLSPTLFFDYPDIESLSNYLAGIGTSQKKPEEVSVSSKEPVAIIGLSCRFPGAKNFLDFDKNLNAGENSITDIPADRWNWKDFYDPDQAAPGKMVTHWGGFIDDVSSFDERFFSISPREAQSMDPQQRLLLELSWEALENAGLDIEKLSGSSTGVFIGIGTNDYLNLQYRFGDLEKLGPYTGIGNSFSAAAGRISYFYGFNGPAMAIDTACSSSLVSIHQALKSIESGESSLAIAGGVNIILSPEANIVFSKAGMMSPEGQCKTFDDSADGYVRGEGCAMLVLKPLSKAKADGDFIYALLEGSAVNQDGKSSGITAPNGKSQEAVIRKALAVAGRKASEVSYVECHGTGTPLGDPIELGAIEAVYGERPEDERILVGSVKTNIGHLEMAAGVAGVLKALIAVNRKRIPASLNFEKPNSHFNWESSSIEVVKSSKEWTDSKRIAGVSSFGFSGTNAHLLISSYDRSPPLQSADELVFDRYIVCLSASSEESLRVYAGKLLSYVKARPDLDLVDLSYTLNCRRTHLDYRAALLFSDYESLLIELESVVSGPYKLKNSSRNSHKKMAFLFTGQGSQYLGMAKQLYESCYPFRRYFDKCDRIFKEVSGGLDLLKIIFGKNEEELRKTSNTQPSLFIVEYCLYKMLEDFGVYPALLLGHSVGEITAACVASVISLEDAIKLVFHRSRLMQALPEGGAMLSVFAPEEDAKTLLDEFKTKDLEVAIVNDSFQTVFSGTEKAVDDFSAFLTKKGIESKKLNVSHAFHSFLMSPALPDFKAELEKINFFKPRIEIISNLSGKLAAESDFTSAEYWLDQLRNKVQFKSCLESLGEMGLSDLVELGPHPVCLGLAANEVATSSLNLHSTLRRKRNETESFLSCLSSLFESGIKIRWSRLYGDGKPSIIRDLPSYSWEHKSHWFEVAGQQKGFEYKGSGKKDIKSSFYGQKWVPVKAPSSEIRSGDNWLLLEQNDTGLSRQIETLLLENNSVTKRNISEFLSDFKLGDSNQLLFVFSYEGGFQSSPDSAEFKQSIKIWLEALSKLSSTLSAVSSPPSLSFVFDYGDKNSEMQRLYFAALSGLIKTLAVETPNLFNAIIELDNSAKNDVSLKRLLGNLVAKKDKFFFLRSFNGDYLIPRVLRSEHIFDNSSLRLGNENYYLVTGAFGGLGRKLVKKLAGSGARKFIFTSRSAPDSNKDTSELNEKQKDQLSFIKELEANGAEIRTFAGDIADPIFVKELFSELSGLSLKGIFHLAGISKLDYLHEMTWEAAEFVMKPKIDGSWYLHEYSKELELDYFCLFSSISSIWGSSGASHYGAANSFMDALHYHRKTMGLASSCINWGPVTGEGMVGEIDDYDNALLKIGIKTLEFSDYLEYFGSLCLNDSNTIICDADWDKLLSIFKNTFLSKVLENLSSETNELGSELNSKVIIDAIKASDNPIDEFKDYLKRNMNLVLGLDESAEIEEDIPFFDLGFDSIMAVELKNKLEEDFAKSYPATLLFNYSNFQKLSGFLLSDLGFNHSAEKELKKPDLAEENLDDLSDEEMADLLAAELLDEED